MPQITVYSKPACVQCKATKKKLQELNYDFSVVDISEDDEARQRLSEAGFVSAPVVEVDGEMKFAGYRPDQLSLIGSMAA